MMFPSVAYGDFVEKVEKLGAKKRVRVSRRPSTLLSVWPTPSQVKL
jgi:hypothetical protein